MTKCVSIIIPVFNGAATIGEAIESALTQQFAENEVIVINDGSTDTTPEIIERYRPAIKVIHRANGGLCAARNTGVMASSGKYIALLDADDIWFPRRLGQTIVPLEGNPASVVAFCDYIPTDGSRRIRSPSCAGRAPSHRDLLEGGWAIVPSAATIRRSALESVGGFCEEFTGCAGGEDHYLWLLLSELGTFEYVPEPLVVHRRTTALETVAKYEPGRRIFEQLVKARYGNVGCLRSSLYSGYLAGLALAGAAEAVDELNFVGAAVLLYYAVSLRPSLVFDSKLLLKVLSTRNVRRLARLLLRPFRRTQI